MTEGNGKGAAVLDPEATEPVAVEAGVAAGPVPDEGAEPQARPVRGLVSVCCTIAGAGVLAGGIFTDLDARAFGITAGVLGALLAFGVNRLRTAWLSNLLILAGLFAIGLACGILVAGPGLAADLKTYLGHALQQARLVRPPIGMTAGFAALLGWIMAGVGFTAAWLAIALRRPSLGLMVPLPVAVVAAISVSQSEQVVDGLILLVLFAAGLAVGAGGREMGEAENGLPLAYELRRAAKALPVLAVVTGGIYGLAQTGVLLPRPIIAPALQAQRPHTQPLSSVTDKVLFEVRSNVDGPWVVGALDVYEGGEWLLPAFASARLKDIPADGFVDRSLQPGLQAQFTIRGQTGAVLPTLPNTVAILASGPRLNFDSRSGNIRLLEGEIASGFTYKVAAATVPSVSSLEKVTSWPAEYRQFTALPAAPPGVRKLLKDAPSISPWDRWDFARRWVLQNVTAAGAGTPVPVSPARVDQILKQKQGSPFEIVAVETMLARWSGIPARIGYGYDGGTKINDHLEVHPRDGAAFPEVWFPGSGWIPVIGQPAHAKASENSDPSIQQFHAGVLPSEDIAVPLFLPAVVPPPPAGIEGVRNLVLLAAAAAAALALLYVLFPLAVKALVRARRRALARAAGPRARVAEAYAEWRDLLTDFGYRHHADTPIMLLRRFPDDEDHAELAWLTTRALWGDLQGEITETMAADAEELSGTLRRRLGQAHPVTERAVAAVSRLSLREPYVAEPAPVRSPRAEVADVAV